MLEMKVRKVGNSLGVVLPKEMVQRLGTGEGGKLYVVETPDSGYRIVPYDPTFDRQMSKAEEIIGRYRNTLKVLAQ